MSEISPIDESILRLLESSRRAIEDETTMYAKELHEAARQQDLQLSVGGMLAAQCTSLTTALKAREAFYVTDANWLQRRRLRMSGHMGQLTSGGRAAEQELTFAEKHLRQHVENKLRLNRKNFTVAGLLPTEIELTDAGAIQQDWQVSTSFMTVTTSLRIINRDRDEIMEITPVHRVRNFGDHVLVSEYEGQIEESEYFLPLGIIMEADKQVRSSVPARVSRKW